VPSAFICVHLFFICVGNGLARPPIATPATRYQNVGWRTNLSHARMILGRIVLVRAALNPVTNPMA
jgi:hypothetical protein